MKRVKSDTPSTAEPAAQPKPWGMTDEELATRPLAFRDELAVPREDVPPGGWPNWVLGNHDQPRIAARVGEAQARIQQILKG